MIERWWVTPRLCPEEDERTTVPPRSRAATRVPDVSIAYGRVPERVAHGGSIGNGETEIGQATPWSEGQQTVLRVDAGITRQRRGSCYRQRSSGRK